MSKTNAVWQQILAALMSHQPPEGIGIYFWVVDPTEGPVMTDELDRWPEYDDLCLTCAGRGWVDLLPLTRAPGTGPREDCRDCGGTGKAPQ